MAASTLARGQGAASEADVPLIVDEDAQAAGEQMAALAAAVANDDAVRLESVRALSSPIASYDGYPYLDEAACTAMKAAIAEDGALFANAARVEGDDGGWGIGTDGASHAVWRTDDAGRTSDHAVTIVGWDDTFSARNFAVACDPDEPHAVGLFATIDSPDGTMMVPTHDGAWIVHDSRGADMGDGGYYYVSYCDLSLRNPVSFRAEAPRPAAEGTVRTSYQYDGLSAVDLPGNQAGGPVGSGRDTAAARSATDLDAQAFCGANVFRARSAGSIDRIGAWATAPGRRIMVQVYTDLARADDPTSGTLAASKTKPVGQAGYYTLELPHAVELSEGEAFSVVVCLQDAVIGSGDLSVPLEGGRGRRCRSRRRAGRRPRRQTRGRCRPELHLRGRCLDRRDPRARGARRPSRHRGGQRRGEGIRHRCAGRRPRRRRSGDEARRSGHGCPWRRNDRGRRPRRLGTARRIPSEHGRRFPAGRRRHRSRRGRHPARGHHLENA